jgi:hypothetical protein
VSAAELVADLNSQGISLVANGHKLTCRGKESTLTLELLESLKARKDELIAFLAGMCPCEPPMPSADIESPFQPNAVTDNLLSRLQAGTRWLTASHQAWLAGKPDAASDGKFAAALAAWTEMERSLRLVFGHRGCIFCLDRRCPDDAPVVCDFCMER